MDNTKLQPKQARQIVTRCTQMVNRSVCSRDGCLSAHRPIDDVKSIVERLAKRPLSIVKNRGLPSEPVKGHTE